MEFDKQPNKNLIPKQLRSVRLIRSAREVRTGCLRRVSVVVKHKPYLIYSIKERKSMEALELVMKDDGLGYGDQVACCPKCGEPFCLPLSIAFAKSKPSTYPCKHCHQPIELD